MNRKTGHETVFEMPIALHKHADVILISSDNVRFPAHKLFLQAASTFFETLFSLPQPPTTSSDLPVIEMAESSTIVAAILQHVYPVPQTGVRDLSELKDVLKAADKFELRNLSTALCSELVSSRFLDVDPLGVYTIASIFNLQAVVKAAFRATLRMELGSLLKAARGGGVVEQLSAAHLVRLLEVRLERVDFAEQTLAQSELERRWALPKCRKCKSILPWAKAWFTQAAAEFRKRPDVDGIFSEEFVSRATRGTNDVCNEYCKFPTFREEFDGRVPNWSPTHWHGLMRKFKNLPDTV